MDISRVFSSFPQPYVVIMVGPPLSGKTFVITKLKKDYDFVHISRDQIVMDVFGSDDYNKAFKLVNQRKVDDVLLSKIEDAAFEGKNVIIDMTNMTRKRRTHNLSFFDGYYKVALVFPFLGEEEYISRNLSRQKEEKKDIPMDIVRRMMSSYQSPSEDEGFDRIINLK